MSSSYTYILSTGVIQADTSALQATIEAEWQTAFGSDLDVSADTPQGVMISAETTARASVIAANTQVANQINPNLAGGIFLEAICALMGLQRLGATFTQVSGVILGGVAGTVIPVGSQVSSQGNIFVSTASATIGSGGTVTVGFQAVESGPVLCPASTLTQIQPNSAVLGWNTVTNPTDGHPGAIEQSDAELWQARINQLGLQGLSGVASQIAALYAVPGVTSLQFQENASSVPVTLNGIAMAANSVWACVAGGTAALIGAALLSGKTCGAGWNGAQNIAVTEPASGQSYTVLYDVPTQIPLKAIINVSQGTSSNSLVSTVTQAVLDFANGVIPGEQGFIVGRNASPFDMAAGIVAENPGVRVREVQLAPISTGIYQTTEIPIAINQQAAISAGQIIVNIV